MPTKKDSSVSGSDDQQKTNAKDKYKLNDMILCRTNDRTGLFYEAKIKGVIEENGETIYQVHYQGWHRRHDEDIPESEVNDRFQEFTPENKEKAVQVGRLENSQYEEAHHVSGGQRSQEECRQEEVDKQDDQGVGRQGRRRQLLQEGRANEQSSVNAVRRPTARQFASQRHFGTHRLHL
jgi:hypothetical protein